MVNLAISQYIDMVSPTIDQNIDLNSSHPLLGKDVWKIVDDNHQDTSHSTAKETSFNFSIFHKFHPSVELLCKLTFLEQEGIRISNSKYTLNSKISTAGTHIQSLKWIAGLLEHLNVHKLSDITSKDIRKVIHHAVSFRVDHSRYDVPVVCKIYFESRLSMLRHLQFYHSSFGLTDALQVEIPTHDVALKIIKNYVSSHTDWKLWIKPKGLGGMPLELVMVLLNKALIDLSDHKVAMALSYFKMRDYHGKIEPFGVSSEQFQPALEALLNNSNSPALTVGYKNLKFWSEEYIAISNLLDISAQRFNPAELFQLYDTNRLGLICERILKSLMTSCCFILLCLSGLRHIEILNLTRDSYSEHKSGGLDLTRKLIKTHNNQTNVKSLSGSAAKAFEVLKLINRNKEVKDSSPLFSDIKFMDYAGAGRTRRMRTEMLVDWVYKTLEETLSDYEKKDHPTPSWHRFRHAWVQTAQHRFDGNTPEAIRIELGHTFGSSMTDHYLAGKYVEEEKEFNKQHIQELIGRIAEGEEMWGPVAIKLRDILSEYEVISPLEIEDIAEQFDIVEVHEYSYCMMPKAEKSLAKCADPITKVAKFENAKFELCGGCKGRLTLANHRDTIIRIGWSAQEQIRVYSEHGLEAATDLATRSLKLAKLALNEIDSKIKLIDITKESK